MLWWFGPRTIKIRVSNVHVVNPLFRKAWSHLLTLLLQVQYDRQELFNRRCRDIVAIWTLNKRFPLEVENSDEAGHRGRFRGLLGRRGYGLYAVSFDVYFPRNGLLLNIQTAVIVGNYAVESFCAFDEREDVRRNGGLYFTVYTKVDVRGDGLRRGAVLPNWIHSVSQFLQNHSFPQNLQNHMKISYTSKHYHLPNVPYICVSIGSFLASLWLTYIVWLRTRTWGALTWSRWCGPVQPQPSNEAFDPLTRSAHWPSF